MRTMHTAIVCVLLGAAPAGGQSLSDVHLVLRASSGADAGISAQVGTGSLERGTSLRAEFSMRDCGSFSVRSDNGGPDPVIGDSKLAALWQLELQTMRMSGTAVTFRLRWQREADPEWRSDKPGRQEVELTLEPGESHVIDFLRPNGFAVKRCGPGYPGLTITAELNEPVNWLERRLVVMDLWLVERGPNGTERTQSLSVRGQPDRGVEFYFDRI